MLAVLDFRNVDASPDDPVSEWPQEAVQTALERGSLSHWRRLAAAIQDEPWGPVARTVEEVLTYSRPYGVAKAMETGHRPRPPGSRDERESTEKVTHAVGVTGRTGHPPTLFEPGISPAGR
jgi:hypothetical protein